MDLTKNNNHKVFGRVIELYAEDTKNGKTINYLILSAPREYNNERKEEKLKFKYFGKAAEKFVTLQPGEEITVTFSIDSYCTEKDGLEVIYNSLNAFHFER